MMHFTKHFRLQRNEYRAYFPQSARAGSRCKTFRRPICARLALCVRRSVTIQPAMPGLSACQRALVSLPLWLTSFQHYMSHYPRRLV
uniref:Uncharacterized protein n=1 Tax=Physcomitrium patens TaxID=3218 RepID=A0A2K1L6Y5_PHYPA|nr:hypothetical protein PHYPA_000187 [Physcomitrium patens]